MTNTENKINDISKLEKELPEKQDINRIAELSILSPEDIWQHMTKNERENVIDFTEKYVTVIDNVEEEFYEIYDKDAVFIDELPVSIHYGDLRETITIDGGVRHDCNNCQTVNISDEPLAHVLKHHLNDVI